MTRFVVDACSIAAFQSQRVLDGGGAALEGMEHLLNTGVIVLDEGDLILQEWLDTCSYASHCALSLGDWINDQLASGKIITVQMEKEQSVRSKMKSLNVPRKDQKYVYIAHCSSASAITTEDVDLHDPAFKGDGRARERLLRNKGGPVCRYIKKNIGAVVCQIEEVPVYF